MSRVARPLTSITLVALALALALATPLPAAEPTAEPVIRMEVAGLNALTADLEALGVERPEDAETWPWITELLGLLGFEKTAWIDGARPVMVEFTMGDATGGPGFGSAAALPFRDREAALADLIDGATSHEEVDGLHQVARTGGSTVYARFDRDHLVAGIRRDVVEAFDPQETIDLPRGTVGLEVRLEPLAPMARMGMAASRQAMAASMAQVDPETGEGPSPAEVEMATEAMELGLRPYELLLDNASLWAVSLEMTGHDVILHQRLTPKIGSELDELLREQPRELTAIGRLLPGELPDAVWVTAFETTPAFTDGLTDLVARQHRVASLAVEQTDPSLAPMMAANQELNQTSWRCQSGENAGSFDLDDEGRWSYVMISRVDDSDSCAEMMEQSREQVALLAEAMPELPLTLTDSAMVHDGVSAMRYDFDPGSMLQEQGTPEDQAIADMFGSQMTSWIARVDDLLVVTGGGTGEKTLRRIIDRAHGAPGRSIVGPETFAPLPVGGGMYASVNLVAALSWIDRLTPEGEPAAAMLDGVKRTRAVFAARPDGGLLDVEIAVPAEVVRTLVEATQAKAAAAKAEAEAARAEAEADAEARPGDAAEPEVEAVPPMPGVLDAPEDAGATGGEGAGSAALEPAGEDAVEPEPDTILLAGKNGVTNPQRESFVKVIFPEPCRLSRIEGQVVLLAVIHTDGTVGDVEPLRATAWRAKKRKTKLPADIKEKATRSFIDAARKAVVQWTYEPALKDGEPVNVYFTIVVDFELT